MNIAFFFQNILLGDLHDLLTGEVSVADPGEIICNWISHFFVFFWTGVSYARYPIVNTISYGAHGARMLPASLLDSRDEAVGGHLAELDAAEAEVTHVSLRTTGQGAAVVKADGGRVLGELVESSPVTGLFESLPLLGVLGDHLGALHLAGFH